MHSVKITPRSGPLGGFHRCVIPPTQNSPPQSNLNPCVEAIAIAWIWTIAEPFTGIIAACLPTLRPLLGFLFSRAFSTAKSGDGNTPGGSEGYNGQTLVTIGGGKARGGGGGYSKPSSKNSSTLRSFTQLEDGDVSESPDLWPKGYLAAREVSAHGPGGRAMSALSDEIPLESIGVKSDMRWTEDKHI